MSDDKIIARGKYAIKFGSQRHNILGWRQEERETDASMPVRQNVECGSKGSERRALWNSEENRKVCGRAAPMAANLETYLRLNPGWEILKDPCAASHKKNRLRNKPRDNKDNPYITVWEPATGELFSGRSAPLRKNLERYFERYPGREVYCGQKKAVGYCAPDPDYERVTMWDTALKRKICGAARPKRRGIGKYQKRHPKHEVYEGQDQHEEKAKKRPKITDGEGTQQRYSDVYWGTMQILNSSTMSGPSRAFGQQENFPAASRCHPNRTDITLSSPSEKMDTNTNSGAIHNEFEETVRSALHTFDKIIGPCDSLDRACECDYPGTNRRAMDANPLKGHAISTTTPPKPIQSLPKCNLYGSLPSVEVNLCKRSSLMTEGNSRKQQYNRSATAGALPRDKIGRAASNESGTYRESATETDNTGNLKTTESFQGFHNIECKSQQFQPNSEVVHECSGKKTEKANFFLGNGHGNHDKVRADDMTRQFLETEQFSSLHQAGIPERKRDLSENQFPLKPFNFVPRFSSPNFFTSGIDREIFVVKLTATETEKDQGARGDGKWKSGNKMLKVWVDPTQRSS